MHEYDAALKKILKGLTASALRGITGFAVARWLDVDLPEVRSRRADLLGETADGELVHIELQSTNQAGMALRMLEYATAIRRQFGKFPRQIVLYVGSSPLRMAGGIRSRELEFSCRMVDIRDLDGQALIASSRVEDNIIAVLAGLGDRPTALRRILRSIAACGPRRRAAAMAELMLLAGLRKLAPVIIEEAEQMPILNDIMDHEVFGPLLRQGIQTGLEKGRMEGERQMVLRLIQKRFGPVPAAARKRIEGLSVARLEKLSLRLLDARNLDELLG